MASLSEPTGRARPRQCWRLAKKAGDSFVTVEYLLLALAMSPGTEVARILKDAGVTAQNLNTAINDLRKGRIAQSATQKTNTTRSRNTPAI